MVRLDELTVSENATTLEAMKVLNKGPAHIALVEDEEKKLIGTVTDGDIRRSVLNGKSIDKSRVIELMNRNFKYIKSNENRKMGLFFSNL